MTASLTRAAGVLRRRALAFRRRVRALLAALRAWFLRRVFLPMRSRRAARLRYAAILDGQTVNLHAELPRNASLPERAEIVLGRGRRRWRTEARVYQGAQGRVLMDAALLLGEELGGAPMADGRAKLQLRVRQGRRSRRYALLLVEPPVPYAGPTKPMEQSAATGARHRIGRSFTGSARIVTRAARASAEVVKVHMDHAGIVVDFRLFGSPGRPEQVEFVASGRVLGRPVEFLAPDVVRVAVPLGGMPPRRNRPDHWDVVACFGRGTRLRLGRRIHDVRNPARVFAIRQLAITPEGLAPMIVQPRYTPAGNLRITCTPMPEAD
ncbi:hypothetical protein [Streptomyces indicus]|uniref:Uncharacterized protein n=1 Tax=Streptomyces indicus TaxID=417292 RepID=A0A1G9ANL7_9ACTN|nr:hypothetical protein [Streptomyces indicus]SDK28959.1 hypothetical protein SAMN05421806_10672 [Streptomyces indicus]